MSRLTTRSSGFWCCVVGEVTVVNNEGFLFFMKKIFMLIGTIAHKSSGTPFLRGKAFRLAAAARRAPRSPVIGLLKVNCQCSNLPA